MGTGEAVSELRSGLARKLTGYAACPGSCGELVQGTWGGVNFLVPCPVKLFSRARITLAPGVPLTAGSLKQRKALQAVANTLSLLRLEHWGGELVIESDIPWGKGMASSTADIGAAVAATASALQVGIAPSMLLQLALEIEPTDGTLLPGITLVDHVRGSWTLPLGTAIPAAILILDLGGQVDTAAFNALPGLAEKNRQNEILTRQAYYLVRQGIQTKDIHLLGQGANLSALANQNILPKEQLAEIQAFARSRDSVGVAAAHSGTVLGLIYDPARNLTVEEKLVRSAFPDIKQCWKTELTGGGVEEMSSDVWTRREFACGRSEVRSPGLY